MVYAHALYKKPKRKVKKAVKNLYKKPRRRVKCKKTIAVLCLISLLLGFGFFVHANFELGYGAYLNGNFLGSVKDLEAGDELIQRINLEFSPYLNGQAAITQSPSYFLKIMKKGSETSNLEIKNRMREQSSALLSACSLQAKEKELISVKSKEEALWVLEELKRRFTNENTVDIKLSEEVFLNETHVPEGMIKTKEEALAFLFGDASPISVITVENAEIEAPIPFESTVLEDASVYEGYTCVAQEGQNGLKKVSCQYIKVNGEVKEETVLGETVLASAVSRVEKIGTKSRPANMGSGTFVRPAMGNLSSPYGERWNRQHKGIDIAANMGDDVYAADNGEVIFSGWMEGFGYLIQIDHNNGYVTYYGHCSRLFKSAGQTVLKGERIAAVGSTGNSTGPHLHFEIRKGGVPQNPTFYIK